MTVSGLLSAWLFLHLGLSATQKAVNPARARAATARLLGPAASLTSPALSVAFAAETGGALALLIPAWTVIGMTVAAVIWMIYAVAASAAWLGGEQQIDCGCTLGSKDRTSDVRLVALRAGFLAALALLLSAGAMPIWHDMTALAAALGFMALGLAASQLRLNHHQQGNLAA